MYVKDLVQSGYVGKVLSCVIYRVTTSQERTSEHVWDLDKSSGATSLTIAAGHTLDTLAFILGEFSELSAWVRTQHSPVRLADTGEDANVTSPRPRAGSGGPGKRSPGLCLRCVGARIRDWREVGDIRQ